MANPSSLIRCDGCGLPASAEHLADRFERLELATRYRPVHISILFVALAPDPQHDFYRSPGVDPVSRLLFKGLNMAAPPATGASGLAGERDDDRSAILADFQRRGYYMSYVCECPIPKEASVKEVAATIAQRTPAQVLRIEHNYRPHKIALLGSVLSPLVGVLQEAGVGPLLLLDEGRPLELPQPDDAHSLAHFRATLAVTARATSS